MLICRSCNQEFPRRPGTQNGLCVECQLQARKAHWKAKTCKLPEKECPNCKHMFRPRSYKRSTFCGWECTVAYKAANRKPKSIRPRRDPSSRVWFAKCRACSELFCSGSSTTLRCVPCRDPHVPRVTRPCEVCGVMVTGTKARRICLSCHHARHRSTRKHRDRAAFYGVAYEAVNPIEVFTRDRWKCQLCGGMTSKRLRGTIEDRAPELDHVVPMSKGGPHTYENTQCSHRKCNIEKGNKPLGQTRMFG